MIPHFDSFGQWLADYYLLSMAMLAVALNALLMIRQPAKRRAVTQAVLIGLIALAALCAIPGWSIVSITAGLQGCCSLPLPAESVQRVCSEGVTASS